MSTVVSSISLRNGSMNVSRESNAPSVEPTETFAVGSTALSVSGHCGVPGTHTQSEHSSSGSHAGSPCLHPGMQSGLSSAHPGGGGHSGPLSHGFVPPHSPTHGVSSITSVFTLILAIPDSLSAVEPGTKEYPC